MLGNPEWDSDGVGFRQWIYQTCTEFGWYQSSDQPDHPYGTKFPLEFSIKVNSSWNMMPILVKAQIILESKNNSKYSF